MNDSLEEVVVFVGIPRLEGLGMTSRVAIKEVLGYFQKVENLGDRKTSSSSRALQGEGSRPVALHYEVTFE